MHGLESNEFTFSREDPSLMLKSLCVESAISPSSPKCEAGSLLDFVS